MPPAPFTAPPPAVVGHRGAPRSAPENTLASFTAAGAAGAGWVELDVRRGADGLVVTHDAYTPDGVAVIERSVAQLQALGIEALAIVLAGMPAGLGIDVEVKNLPGEPDADDTQETVERLAPVLRAAGARPVMTSSFNPATVSALADALPGIPAGFLTGPGLRCGAALRMALDLAAGVVCPHADAPDLDAGFVGAAHAQGLAVLVWTVDQPELARGLAALGVDAICTNEPGALVRVLG